MLESESRSSSSVFRKRFELCSQSGSTSQTGSCGSDDGKAAAMLLELLHQQCNSKVASKCSCIANFSIANLLIYAFTHVNNLTPKTKHAHQQISNA